MLPPEIGSPARAEWDLLHALRASPALLQQVEQAPRNELQLQTQLRREFPEPLVRGAFALCELRRKGRVKFARADHMWFDRAGLEQSTAEAVARHKALRFAGSVYDICSGIGGDSLALGERGTVQAVDLNPAACLRTVWNAETYNVAANVTALNVDASQLDLRGALVHIDPDRRAAGGARAGRLEDYRPGLEFLQRLMATARGGAIKVGPAANFMGKFPDAEIELISLEGECKEATVWFGALRSEAPWRATVLPEGATIAGHPLDFAADVAPLGRYLCDPDPAVVRAGLVDAVATSLGLWRLDREEEYLAGDQVPDSAFVRTFEVVADLPNNHTEIRKYFRASPFGQAEIKCRRIPIEIEALRKKLPLPGDEPGVLIFARVGGRARAIVCKRAPRKV